MQSIPEGESGSEHPVNARSPRSGRLPLVASALERAGKRSPAVLRLLARAKAIPGEARLALNRFPTRCIRNDYLDRVLAACLIKPYSFSDHGGLPPSVHASVALSFADLRSAQRLILRSSPLTTLPIVLICVCRRD